MKEFKTLCRDTITNGVMVLSEVSYNNACFYLESKGFECWATQEKNGITELAGKFNGKGEPQVFIYDESRGYLIKKERSIA